MNSRTRRDTLDLHIFFDDLPLHPPRDWELVDSGKTRKVIEIKSLRLSLEKSAFEVAFREHLRCCLVLCEALSNSKFFPKLIYFTCKEGIRGTKRTITLECGLELSYLDLGEGQITALTFAEAPVSLSKLTDGRRLSLPGKTGPLLTLKNHKLGAAVERSEARFLKTLSRESLQYHALNSLNTKTTKLDWTFIEIKKDYSIESLLASLRIHHSELTRPDRCNHCLQNHLEIS